MRRLLSAARRAIRAIRSRSQCAYVRLAYPGTRFGRRGRIGRGARLRAFDGGRLEIGDDVYIGDFALLEVHGGTFRIGDRCEIGRGSVIVATQEIAIGGGTLIAEHVTIRDQDHRHESSLPLAQQGAVTAPVHVGRDVWIGAKVTVTRGVVIADHVVIGANAVVTHSLAERGVYGGVPARPLPKTGDNRP